MREFKMKHFSKYYAMCKELGIESVQRQELEIAGVEFIEVYKVNNVIFCAHSSNADHEDSMSNMYVKTGEFKFEQITDTSQRGNVHSLVIDAFGVSDFTDRRLEFLYNIIERECTFVQVLNYEGPHLAMFAHVLDRVLRKFFCTYSAITLHLKNDEPLLLGMFEGDGYSPIEDSKPLAPSLKKTF